MIMAKGKSIWFFYTNKILLSQGLTSQKSTKKQTAFKVTLFSVCLKTDSDSIASTYDLVNSLQSIDNSPLAALSPNMTSRKIANTRS